MLFLSGLLTYAAARVPKEGKISLQYIVETLAIVRSDLTPSISWRLTK